MSTKNDCENNVNCVQNKISFKTFLMWISLVIFFIYQLIARSSFPTVLTEQFMEYFNLDSVSVGVLISCYYIAYTLVQIPVGIISDKYNPRKIGVIVSFFCALGVCLFILTKNYYLACFGQLLCGVGSAFAFILIIKIVATMFPKNQVALWISISISLGSLGPVLFGPMVADLVKTFYWRNVMLSFSAIGMLISAFIWCFVPDIKQAKSKQGNSSFVAVLRVLKDILLAPQAWYLALFTMALYAPLSAIADLWGVAFLKEAYGIDGVTASRASNMLYVGLIIGSPLIAYLLTIINSYKKTMLYSILLAVISFSCLVFLNVSLTFAFILLFLTGVACGGMITYALSALIFPPHMCATVSSFINMGSMLSGVILQPLVGWLIKMHWDGSLENNLPNYNLADYKFGLLSVLVFLLSGVVFCLFIEDRSPNENQ